ncbi:MAG: hypothetical protein CVU91_07705 [Firmicutes bacterium HGW-Firmicutes-16]|nr:MAG: hypothetical protein CVU91_07705 [Firmicutes bacterium HGW-Firmicutes-16]
MTKNEYLKKLGRALRQITRAEREKSLAYFSEVIDDRMEEGISEEVVVAELESVEAAAERIITEARAQGQLKAKHSVWEIVLIVLGFPLWFPVLLTISLTVLTVYALVWVIIGALFLVSAALVVSGVAGIVGLFMYLGSSAGAAFAIFGIGLAGSGLGIAMFIPVLYIAQAYAKATPAMWQMVKSRKEVY